jgi:hypothetical protein
VHAYSDIVNRIYTGVLLVMALLITYVCAAVALGFVWALDFSGAPPFVAAGYLGCAVAAPIVAARRTRGAGGSPRLRRASQALLAVDAVALPFALLSLTM